MILAGVATYFNSRASVARQSPEAAANPQTAMMNKLALYVFPLGVVVGGPFLPLAIILYWFANNIWTFGQQHYVFGKIEKEEEAKKLEAIERRAANAPPPGAKPNRTRKARRRTERRHVRRDYVQRGHRNEVTPTGRGRRRSRRVQVRASRAPSRGATAQPQPRSDTDAQAHGPRSESVDRTHDPVE